jgi:hypothetical protein
MSTFDKFVAGGPWAGGVTSTSAVVKTSVKGGVYSHGTEYKGGMPGKGVAGSGQFGIFEVTYTSANGAALDTPRVVWRGRRANGGSAKDVIWYEFNAANPWANF